MTVHVYSLGILACSVCVPADWDVDRVEKEVNAASPTTIRTPWMVDHAHEFKDSSPNPHFCERDSNRSHWLMQC